MVINGRVKVHGYWRGRPIQKNKVYVVSAKGGKNFLVISKAPELALDKVDNAIWAEKFDAQFHLPLMFRAFSRKPLEINVKRIGQ